MAQLTSKLPPLGDVAQFFGGQFFGKTTLPDVDFTDKVIVVTGANGGLGFEAARHFLHLGVSRLIMAVRDVSKGEEAKKQLVEELTVSGREADIEVWKADLDDYSSIVDFVRKALDYQDSDGLERSIKVNVITTMLQAIGVLPILRDTANKHATDTILTIVGSMAHAFAPDSELDVSPDNDLFKTLSDPATTNMAARYPLSKLMVQLCARELAAQLETDNKSQNNRVIVNVVNPGWCKTDLFRDKNDPLPVRVMLSLVGRTAEQGSRTLVHAVAQGEESHGKYLSESQIKPESQFMRSDKGQQVQKRLWKELMARLEAIDPEIAGYIGHQ